MSSSLSLARAPGHPPGLYVLFFTEMWERFGFYVMAALFVLYMKDEEAHDYTFLHKNASLINGTYLGLVYFTPFLGGLWADRQLGYRWSIVLGAVVMGLGFFLMAFYALEVFFAGVACVVLGNGLFKPNISTLVGKLYPANDPRLDNAYTIFYMGINLGAFLAPLVAGPVRAHFGYPWAFSMAGFGMGVSLVIFLACQRFLVFDRPGEAAPLSIADEERVPPDVQWRRHMALLVVFVLVALFWMAFKQNSNTLALWFRDSTDRTPPAFVPSALLDKDGWLPAEMAAAINPFFVIAFSPLMVLLWMELARGGKEPSTPAKIGLAMLLTAGAFGIMALAGLAGGDEGERVSPWYLVGAYAVVTLAELCLSPIGLSLVSKLAAKEQRSAWMGGWFAATALGGYASGLIGQYWDDWPHSTFFFVLVCSSLGAFVLLLVCFRWLVDTMPAKRPAVALPEGGPALPVVTGKGGEGIRPADAPITDRPPA